METAITSTDDGYKAEHEILFGQLALGFTNDGGTTRLTRREHFGPLLVQKPLYPEGTQCCHAIIVHPPGGIVGGDRLLIEASAAENTHALLSTPGAAKWYRANGRVSQQRVHLQCDAGAVIEWLPQETILFDQAHVVLDTQVKLHSTARFIGCEILCFGRTASGERFTRGQVQQRYSVQVDGKPLWLEQGTLRADGAAMSSPIGLVGHTVCASLLCVGVPARRDLIDEVRATITPLAEPAAQVGVTQMKSLMMIRYLGDASETARQVMLAAWRVLRPAMLGRASTELRIWNT